MDGMQTISPAPGWIARTGSRIDLIRINDLSRDTIAGVPVWVKRRTWLSRLLVPVANGFFWLAGNPVEVFATNAEWQRNETRTFLLLNGENRRVGALRTDSVYAEALPGTDLVGLLRDNDLTPEVMQSVGKAFRQMHRTLNPATGELFSHGDPHLGNVLYDDLSQSVNWVDFETIHCGNLDVRERHADDLLVLLLDLVGRASEEQWQSLSPAFLQAYQEPGVLAELKNRLRLPSGLGAIWWAVRTSYLGREELRRRIHWLRECL